MRLSQKCIYGLLAVYELAAAGAGQSRTINEIAAAQDVPTVFLQTILRELRNSGIVESRRGKEGGYLLSRPARTVTLAEVIRCLDGEIAPVDEFTHAMALTEEMKAIAESVRAKYEQVNFADVILRAQLMQNEGLDFCI